MTTKITLPKEFDIFDPSIFPDRDLKGLIIHILDLGIGAGIRRRFEAAGADITPENFMVLAMLVKNEGAHQSQLARLIHKNRHNMTRIITAIEQKGYVERRSDGGDKRRLLVFLTDQGRAVLEKYAPIVAAFSAEVFNGIPEEDLQTMQQTHLRILSNLGFEF
ncbi:MarR family transcriptional regulator [Desulfoluna sp.]|uniref:MarR family winged helix-turn-helix transcriptional regulator n=1 Tax=Desulfoluna sp. TaxID=2045199 RepID=UPI00262B826F|nr:MarR family transcriptional regulator [Desulfoluna sp.]